MDDLLLSNGMSKEDAIESLLEKSQNNFLYLQKTRERVRDLVAKGRRLDVEELPVGLGGLFEEQMERMYEPFSNRHPIDY